MAKVGCGGVPEIQHFQDFDYWLRGWPGALTGTGRPTSNAVPGETVLSLQKAKVGSGGVSEIQHSLDRDCCRGVDPVRLSARFARQVIVSRR